MAYLCLDLSLKCSGWAKFSNDGKLMHKGRIIPDKELNNCFKIHFIVERIKDLFDKTEEVLIEDVYVAKNPKAVIWLSRLAGAVVSEWVNFKYKEVHFMNASHARALAGVNGHSHKCEIQTYILDKYGFAEPQIINKYQKAIDDLKLQYKKKKLKRGQYKYRLDKISREIDEETGIGEDVADSLILGLAFAQEKKNEKS